MYDENNPSGDPLESEILATIISCVVMLGLPTMICSSISFDSNGSFGVRAMALGQCRV